MYIYIYSITCILYIYIPQLYVVAATSGGGRLVGSGTAQALRGALARLCGSSGAAGHGELEVFGG